MACLEQLTGAIGGRRGRAAERTQTQGLIYAVTRHATSRADPGPPGHLGHWAIAGVPEMVMDAHSKRAAEIAEEMERTADRQHRPH